MINNYQVPQATIAQVLEETANPLLDRIHAVVVGPAFVHADSAAGNLVWDEYTANTVFGFRRLVDGSPVALGNEVIDLGSVQLRARDLRLELFNKGTTTGTPSTTQFRTYAPDPTGELLLFNGADGISNTNDVSVVEAFDKGRAPAPGDLFRITTNLGTVERKVVSLIGRDLASAAGSRTYFGALPWQDSSADNQITVAYTNVAFTAPPVIDAYGNDAELFFHRFGRIAPTGGLRISAEITCTQAGDRTSAVFSAVVNGAPVAISNVAAVGAGVTDFTLFDDLDFSVERSGNNWAQGDRFTLTIDIETSGDLNLLDDGNEVDVAGYTFNDSKRRIPSTLHIEVIAIADNGNTTLRISDSSGLLTPVTKVVSGATTAELNYDGGVIEVAIAASWTYTTGRRHVGQRESVLVTPPSRSSQIFDKVRLNGPIGLSGSQTGVQVQSYVSFTGTVPATEAVLGATNYLVSEDGLETEGVTAAVNGYPLPADSVKSAVSGFGDIAVVFRAAKPVGTTEGLVPADSEDDIVEYVGSSRLESQLGYGAKLALGGSQQKRIYLLNTGADTVEAFAAALQKLESSEFVYTIGFATANPEAQRLLAGHALRMSASDQKRFRRGYVGVDSPGEYPILSSRGDGSTYSASISAGTGGNITLVTFQDNDVNLELLEITRGDKFRIDATGDEYLIDFVAGEKTLVLQEGPVAPVAVTPSSVIAADTPANTARYVWTQAAVLGANPEERRRVSLIWTHRGVLDLKDGNPTAIPNWVGACEAAGLRTALQPQQSLTRTEVSFINSAPSMYTEFSSAVLDQMAARGVWIVTQRSADRVPYIRHQITTSVSNGSLYYEDSVGTNVDTICFGIDDIVEPLIGKRNATPKTVAEIKNLLIDFLSDQTEDAYDSVLGAQIVNFYNKAGEAGTLDVEIDANFKDRINVTVILEIPLPLNNIKVVVLARTIRLDNGTTVNALSTSVL